MRITLKIEWVKNQNELGVKKIIKKELLKIPALLCQKKQKMPDNQVKVFTSS